MSKDRTYRNHPNNPGAQRFMGAASKKDGHWSNVRGHNNVTKGKKGE